MNVDVINIAREDVCENIKDSVIILDSKNRILYLNNMAKKIFKNYKNLSLGEPINEILIDYKSYFENMSERYEKQAGSRRESREFRGA